MNATLLSIAAEVVRQASRDKPADAVLRAEFKRRRDLFPGDFGAVSRAVFAFYRWFGWSENGSVTHELARALEIQEEFVRRPSAFPDKDLISKAVPAWTPEHVKFMPQWVRALQAEPKLWLRARPGHGAELLRKLRGGRVAGDGVWADALQYDGALDLFRTAEFHAGEFEIQDISSQEVSVACEPKPTETWWDACAGEGGKTIHLSDLMGNRGLIWASDQAAWRLQKLKRRAARAKVFNYRSAPWYGGAKLPTKTKFDGVLVDAPCSGIGTWQRNPHARWTTTPEDVLELSRLQAQLLAHAAPAVKPGGKLVYAVCTLTRAETTGVAAEFEAKFSQFRPMPLVSRLAMVPGRSPLWIWPQEGGGNGMFVAAWRRE